MERLFVLVQSVMWQWEWIGSKKLDCPKASPSPLKWMMHGLKILMNARYEAGWWTNRLPYLRNKTITVYTISSWNSEKNRIEMSCKVNVRSLIWEHTVVAYLSFFPGASHWPIEQITHQFMIRPLSSHIPREKNYSGPRSGIKHASEWASTRCSAL